MGLSIRANSNIGELN